MTRLYMTHMWMCQVSFIRMRHVCECVMFIWIEELSRAGARACIHIYICIHKWIMTRLYMTHIYECVMSYLYECVMSMNASCLYESKSSYEQERERIYIYIYIYIYIHTNESWLVYIWHIYINASCFVYMNTSCLWMRHVYMNQRALTSKSESAYTYIYIYICKYMNESWLVYTWHIYMNASCLLYMNASFLWTRQI